MRTGILFALSLSLACAGCGACSRTCEQGYSRTKALGKSVLKTNEEIAESVLYTDSLFTNDGRSRLSPN